MSWNAKVGTQEIPQVTGKFGLGVREEAGQRLIEFGQENALVITCMLLGDKKVLVQVRSNGGDIDLQGKLNS